MMNQIVIMLSKCPNRGSFSSHLIENHLLLYFTHDFIIIIMSKSDILMKGNALVRILCRHVKIKTIFNSLQNTLFQSSYLVITNSKSR